MILIGDNGGGMPSVFPQRPAAKPLPHGLLLTLPAHLLMRAAGCFLQTIALLLKRCLPRRRRRAQPILGLLLNVALIFGGVPIAICAGYISWCETESVLATVISAGFPALLVLAGIITLTD